MIKATIFQTFPLSGNCLVSSLNLRFVANPQIQIRQKKTSLEKKREFCRVTFVEEELVGAKFKIGAANAFLKRFTRRHK